MRASMRAVVVVGLLVAAGAWAGGGKESGAWFRSPEGSGPVAQQFAVKATYEAGQTRVELGMPDRRADVLEYGLVKDGQRYLGGWSGRPYATTPELSVVTQVLNRARSGAGEVVALQNNAASVPITRSEYREGTGIGLTATEKSVLKARGERTAGIGFGWRQGGEEEREFEVLAIYRSGAYRYFRIVLVAEFFPGERELFGSVEGSWSYAQKALAFLGTFFEPGVAQESFRKVMVEYHFAPADTQMWGMFAGQDIGAEQRAFRKAFLQHFRYRADVAGERALPYAEDTGGSFQALYGAERNVYVSAYLAYVYEIDKPVLSALTDERAGVEYDYRDYLPITVAEGQRLAEAALRYFSWGVEYTSYPGQNSVEVSGTGNVIAGDGKFAGPVRQWANATDGSRQAQTNYLPAGATFGAVGNPEQTSAELSRVHVLDALYRGSSITVAAPGTPSVRASRVDVWTSRNLAWNTGRIKKAIAGAGTSDLSAESGGYLNDRKIRANTTAGAFSVDRGEQRGTEVRFGYEFEDKERVGGLIIVNGKGEVPAAGGWSQFGQDRWFVVKYKATATGDWQVWDTRSRQRYREYAYSYADGTYVDNSERPGWSLAHGEWYTGGNAHAGYVYVVFPEGLDCYGVQVIERSGNRTVTVSELMVFGEDPVSYLSSRTANASRDIALGSVIRSVVTAGEVDVSPVVTNGRMGANEGVELEQAGGGSAWVTISFPQVVEPKSVVVWEEDHQGNGGRSDLGREFVVLAGGSDLLESGYLNTRAELERGVRPAITSPFVEGQNVLGVKRYRQGNPLPYAPQGVDSPRTFAYKMLAQEGARRWYAGKEKEEEDRFPVRTAEGVVSTTAKDRWGQERYRGGYVTEQEVLQAANPEKVVRLDGEQKYVDRTGLKPPTMRLGETEVEITLKPYLPGWTAPSRTGYLTGDSPYQREKVAGVDAVGLLMGSIAMTGEGENGIAGKVRSALNVFVGQKLNEYYGMQGGASGIGVDGRPVFGSSTTESPLSGYRFTRGDIERATVLVPDVSLVQAGDLVVRYGVEGEAQVGIVVKVLDGARPVYGEAPGEFLQRIVVATVRRGFREVTVGTWGNSGGTFGGFTAEPERYQLRRLLKYVENNGEKAAKPEENGSWELVKEVPVRVRDYYPPDVPTRRFLRYAAALLPAADTVWNLVTKGWLFERNLPPTSYDNKVGSMIGTAENPPRPLPMVLTESTGWRYREIPGRVLTTYHPAIDIALAGDALGKYIIAPESGEFSVMAVDPLERIRLPDGDVLDLGVGFDSPSNIKPEERLTGPGSYAFTAYGVVGVLVTNPTRPKDGRIYLYAHQGHNQANEGEVGRTLEGVYRAVYTGDPRGQLALPRMEDDDVATWVKVSAGEWIGQVGDQGVGSKAHIHLEVLEYFERTSDGEPLGAWRRINPQSLFRDGIWSTDWKSSIYDSSPDHVEQLLKLEFMSNRHGSEANKPEPDALKAAEGHFRPSPY